MSNIATTALALFLLPGCLTSPDAAGLLPASSDDVARTFSASVAALGVTARGAALLGVAVVPWSLPTGFFVLGTITLVRRRRAHQSAT